MPDEAKDKKCSRCKTYSYPSQFLNETGRLLKTCEKCRKRAKDSRDRNKCEHDRRRSKCKECGGASICEHNRQRSQCKNCGGGGICDHGRVRSHCKECKDPIKLTIGNMIRDSRSNDKKYNRYDADRHIDMCFLEALVEEYSHCYYEDCKAELQYVKYQDDLATIERLDNDIGHIKSNCVLCCLKCNHLKKSKKKLKAE